MSEVGAVVAESRPEEALRNGDPAEDEARGQRLTRFEALFRRDANTVLAYAMRRSDVETAHDVVAETFAIAWRRLDSVPDPALPWLLGVARKVVANQRRAHVRADALTLRLVREPLGTADDPADVVHARLSAQAALDALAPKERELLELIAWEGLTPTQAAEVLGCSRVTIAVRMHRSRRRFLAKLDEPATDRIEDVDHGTAPVGRRPQDPAARGGGS